MWGLNKLTRMEVLPVKKGEGPQSKMYMGSDFNGGPRDLTWIKLYIFSFVYWLHGFPLL